MGMLLEAFILCGPLVWLVVDMGSRSIANARCVVRGQCPCWRSKLSGSRDGWCKDALKSISSAWCVPYMRTDFQNRNAIYLITCVASSHHPSPCRVTFWSSILFCFTVSRFFKKDNGTHVCCSRFVHTRWTKQQPFYFTGSPQLCVATGRGLSNSSPSKIGCLML